MPTYNKIILIILTIFTTGCAHQIQLTPDLDDLKNTNVEKQYQGNAAYYISEEDKNLEVKTPGGGGDDVKYFPYKDTEAALNTMLLKVFDRVYSLPEVNDREFIQKKDIKYIFQPEIKTSSSSGSAFTWPPTDFSFKLTLSAIDIDGKEIWQETVIETGHAEFDEFKHDFSLSARRASEEAFEEMLYELMKAKSFE